MLHIGADIRVLSYGESAIGYASIGAGRDLHRASMPGDDTSGMGLNVGVGVAGRISRHVALGGALLLHPGSSRRLVRDDRLDMFPNNLTVSYVALQFEASVF
jgi:hypothetical protein